MEKPSFLDLATKPFGESPAWMTDLPVDFFFSLFPIWDSVWDLETGTEKSKLKGRHYNYVSSVAISPDGKTIVSGSGDNTIR